MKKATAFITVLIIISTVAGCSQSSAPARPTSPPPTDTLTPTQTTAPTETPEPTIAPTETPEPTIAPTVTPTCTPKPTATPIPIDYVTLGSPFAAGCGDGVPLRIFDNSFNGLFRSVSDFDAEHGHVDLVPPTGCDALNYAGEIVAPVSGYLYPTNSPSYFIDLPANTVLSGIERVLQNAGVESVDPEKIDGVTLNLAHFEPSVASGRVEKGQPIGDMVPDWGFANPVKFAYQVIVRYYGRQYWFSPTMFMQATGEDLWPCINDQDPGAPHACDPQYNWYP